MLGFRVWDNEKKRFIKELVFAVNMDGDLWCSDGDYEDCGTHEASDNFIPLQSTGFMDSEGNEIFEGDILAHIALTDKSHPHYYINVLDTISFLWCIGHENIGVISNRIIRTYKIVGNKYSNPDLLEKVKC